MTRSPSAGSSLPHLLNGEIDWYRFLERPRLPSPTAHHLQRLSHLSILITGAGGSIGSALALRLAAISTRNLVLIDASEQALFRLDTLLNEAGFAGRFATILGSTRDVALLDEVFSIHRPQLVFHAAAHKHLALLESHPIEAIANNTLRTQTLLDCARNNGRPRFVLLSTDKAVEPASILGVSKHLAEQITLAHDGIVLRLGNVLASEGSVAERFLHELASGRPMTITDPRAERFFLTCEEAVDLLLTAASSAEPASMLVPDLNRSHRVSALADFLVAFLGNSAKIPAPFTGLKPGEKLSERLASANEIVAPSNLPGLNQISPSSPSTQPNLVAAIASLEAAIRERDLSAVLHTIRMLVPSYTPSKTVLALEAQSLHEVRTP